MGKIVMPKNSALLNEIESVLDIYYHNNGWMPNDEYKVKLKAMIGDDQYVSSYTKKAQITSYFGFTEWEIDNPQSRRRITDSGKKMYEALKRNDTVAVQEILMHALETVKFGRDNFGCPTSDSDVEPPALFIRATLDLGYLTYREFAFLLWKLEDIGANYTDALNELRGLRSKGSIDIGEEANKYADCKPIMILVRWGFLSEDNTSSVGGKHIIIAPSVLSKYKSRLRNLKIYNIDMDVDKPIAADQNIISSDENTKTVILENKRLQTGTNILLYGVPGSGKSYTIQKEYCSNESRMERLVFHPDYTYSDFVGQIQPDISDGSVSYRFMPGPFTSILEKAYKNPEHEYFLIIEEINRGNAPAVFGEVFQLLDRKDRIKPEYDDGYPVGTSEYGITNTNIAKIVYGDSAHKVRIPSNLSIIGTMNTSDQNVFTLDTAFQRRWSMRLIESTFDNVEDSFKNHSILDSTITWKGFCEAINTTILTKSSGIASGEDKRMGPYFIHISDLEYDAREDDENCSPKERIKAKHHNSLFAEKVIKYLWDDAFKFSRTSVFKSNFISLEQVIRAFSANRGDERFSMFTDDMVNYFHN